MAKYLVFIEVDSKEYDKVITKSTARQEYEKKHPGTFPKQILEPHRLLGDIPKLTKDLKGISIVETDDPQTIVNSKAFMIPEITNHHVPIVTITEFREALQKFKE